MNIVVTKLVEEKNIPFGLGVLNFVPGLASVIYPYILDHLYQRYALSGTFLLLGGISLHSLTIATLSLVLESDHDKRTEFCVTVKDTDISENQAEVTETPRDRNIDKKIRRVVRISSSIVVIMYTTVTTLVSLCIGGFIGLWRDMFSKKELSTSQSNVAFMAYAIMNAIVRLLPILAQKFESLSVFFVPTACSLFGLIGFLLLFAFSKFEMTVLGACFVGLSGGGVISAASLVMYEILGKEAYPAGYGFFLTTSGVAAIASGIVFGNLLYLQICLDSLLDTF